jgi:hypothetical protein
VLVGYNGTASYQLGVPGERKLISSRDIIFEEGSGHRSLPPAGGDVEIAGGEDLHVPVGPVQPETNKPPPAPTADSDATEPIKPIVPAPAPLQIR